MRKFSKCCHICLSILKENYLNSANFNCYSPIIFHFFFFSKIEGIITASYHHHFQIEQKNLPRSTLKK